MTDPISATASAVTIADRIVAAGSWMMRRIRGNDSGHRLPGEAHDGLELRPLIYQIDLVGDVPRVRVDFIAINYLKKTIELRELKISLLTGTGHVDITNVPLDREVVLQPRSSFPVFCSRVLTDTESRGSTATPGYPVIGGAIAFVARGRTGRREIQYGPVAAKVINGSVLAPRQTAV